MLSKEKIVDTINRAYYAMFHATRALLLLFGEEPKTHEGIIRTFSRIIVEKNLMDKKYGSILGKFLKQRSLVIIESVLSLN